jgi:hypothetical protein
MSNSTRTVFVVGNGQQRRRHGSGDESWEYGVDANVVCNEF